VGLKNFSMIKYLLEQRDKLIRRYRQNLSELPGVFFQHIPEDRTSSFNYFVMGIDESKSPLSRDQLFEKMKKGGIQTKRYFHPVVPRQTAYRQWLAGETRLPVAERLSSQAIALPLYSHMSPGEVDQISEIIKSIFEGSE
jgi:dTDP-4-amino-4,6-dideoxygalactose transaminase